jgi:hypothetical protein
VPVAAYIARFREEQRLKRKRQNEIGNEKKRQRQITAALARSPEPARVVSSASLPGPASSDCPVVLRS